MADERLTASGEVSDRQELLDGRSQVVLDGDAEGVTVFCTLTWSIGREGDVPIEEADLTLEDAGSELNATLAEGTLREGRVRLNEDTGAASVTVTLSVDGADDDWGEPPDEVQLQLEIGVDEWSGEVRLVTE